MPPLKEFFTICDYFDISPAEFFDTDSRNPELINKAVEGMRRLDESDVIMLLSIINRLQK